MLRIRQADEIEHQNGFRLELVFEGLPIPSKKNGLMPTFKRSGRKGLMYKPEFKGAIEALEGSTNIQWGKRPAVLHPEIEWLITAPSPQDRDGMITTLLDVFVKCGILVDDSIRHNNGKWTTWPASIGPAGARVILNYAR